MRKRLARLDGNLPQVQRTQRLHRRLDVVLFAHRHTAAGQNHIVRLRCAAQSRHRGVQLVGHDAQVRHRAAHAAQQAGQKEAVGVVNRARRHVRRRALTGHHQLVAGGKQGHARSPGHLQLRHSHAGCHPQARRAQTLASAQHTLACGNILALAPNPLADRRPGVHHNGALPLGAAFGAVFLHQHRVCTHRNRRAGKDARHGSRHQRRATGARRNALGHRQHRTGCAIGGPQRVAVHGTVVLRRHPQGRHHVLRQHAAIGVKGRNCLQSRRVVRQGAEQLAQRVVQGNQGLARRRCVHTAARIKRRPGRSGL